MASKGGREKIKLASTAVQVTSTHDQEQEDDA
jgi:hypothetical protein